MQIPSGNSIPGNSAPLQQARAVVSPAAPDAGKSAISSFKFTAGGGLLAGIVAGFVLISGGSDPAQANAETDKGPKKVALLGDDTGPVGDDDSNGVVEENSGETELTENAGGDPTQISGETPGGETLDEGTIETKPVVAPEPSPSDPNATKFFVRFEVRPAILRDRVSISVDGESYDIRSFYTLSLKSGAKSKKIKVTAKAEGYRDFKGSQVIRHDDQFVIQMKEMPASAEPTPKKPVAKKPVSKKPTVRKPRVSKPNKPRKPRKPRNKPKGPGALISL